MDFHVDVELEKLCLLYEGEDQTVDLHRHALGQMAEAAGIPRRFVTLLLTGDPGTTCPDYNWMLKLLAHNFNELFHHRKFEDGNGPRRYLHRLVNGEVRGFLSNRFGVAYSTKPLIKAFLETCRELNAGPVDAFANDIRVSMKCYLPFVFEPVDKEFVAFGTSFANSDFGSGRLRICTTAMRINSRTESVIEESHSRTHIGRILTDSDLNPSEDTIRKEVQAQQSAIGDVVQAHLGVGNIKKMIKMIQLAHEHKLPWYKLKDKLSKVLYKKEVILFEELLKGASDIVDLPTISFDDDGDPQATAWWAANTLSWMANKEKDDDRREQMKSLAGDLLETAA
jgi:hypothetical protein